MKKGLKQIFISFVIMFLFALSVEAVTIFSVPQGGTGVGTLTGLIKGNGTSAFSAITTSAGIAGVISDETGTGNLVFSDSPVFTTTISTPLLTLTGTGTINGLDAIDATTETTLESALDIAGDISGTGLGSVTIGNDKILESMLKAVDAAVDEDILTYESTTGDFEWHTCAQITGSASLCDGNDAGGTITGSDTHVMFFDGANTPAGDAGMTYDKTTDSLTIVGDFTFGNSLVSTGDMDAQAGGAMTFSALATAGAGTDGKNVEFYAGAGGTGNTAGGQVLLKGGIQSGSGAVGYTAIVDPTSGIKGILSMASLATSDKTFTFPNTSGTIALTSNKLSAFAATSSAELAGVLSNETGSGLVVYGTSPSISTSMLLDTGFVFNWDSSDVTLTHSANTLTLAGGNLALGTNSITMTGSLGATGARLTKGWFTDLEVTNAIVGSITGNSATATALLNARTIGGVSFDGTANITVASATGGFTVSGGNLALGTNSLTLTGSIASTGSRVTKGWFTDLEVTNSIVGSITGNSATATALASDPSDCSANQYAHTIATSGNLTCSSIDISNSTNLAAGRSLTLSGDSVEADAELYTDTKTIWWENPVAGDDFKSIWVNDTGGAITITKLWCESDQTATLMPQVDDGTPADVDSVDLVCISTPDTDTSLDGDATMAAGDRLDIDVASVSGTPTWVSVGFTFTKDD